MRDVLVERAQAGDDIAFNELVDLDADRRFAIAVRIPRFFPRHLRPGVLLDDRPVAPVGHGDHAAAALESEWRIPRPGGLRHSAVVGPRDSAYYD